VTGAVSLQSVLVLLASSVVAVALCRHFRLPPVIGYLTTGLALGPHALRIAANPEETQQLAEFGVVFLMFSIGLEFSLGKLRTMRRMVFGLGFTQVGATLGLAVCAALVLDVGWQAGVALGAVAAMSSTAIVSKLLTERWVSRSQRRSARQCSRSCWSSSSARSSCAPGLAWRRVCARTSFSC